MCSISNCDNGYGCLDIGCVYKHPNNYNYIDTFDQFVQTKKIPCKFGIYCLQSNCNNTKSHPDTWDINEVYIIESMRNKYKSNNTIIKNDIKKLNKLSQLFEL